MQRSALCRSRRELSNVYLLAKFRFDTAENEPCEVCPLSVYRSPRFQDAGNGVHKPPFAEDSSAKPDPRRPSESMSEPKRLSLIAYQEKAMVISAASKYERPSLVPSRKASTIFRQSTK